MQKKFRVIMSPKCYRFKPDAIPSHAPEGPGVYEFVTFDERRQAKVLFVGLAEKSVRERLVEHLMGRAEPSADALFAKYRDVYFDFVARSDGRAPEDFADIAGALAGRHRPEFNPGAPATSGRYQTVDVEEVEIL